MKTTLITLFGMTLLALPAAALEKRVFTSADGSKQFEAVLADYNAKKGLVSVKKPGVYAPTTFKLALLSETDIAYVKENATAVIAAKAIRIDFDLYKEKPQRVQTSSDTTITTPVGYDIDVSNWTKKNIENVELRYTIFHRKGAEDGPGSMVQTKGSIHLSTLFNNSEYEGRTESVNIVRYIKQKSGGG